MGKMAARVARKQTKYFSCLSYYLFFNIKIPNHRYYSRIVNCRTNIPAIIRGLFQIFRSMSVVIFNHPTIYSGTPNDILRNPGWETPF